METINLGASDGLPPIDWSFVTGQLDTGVLPAPDDGARNRHTTWLTTINEDGSPHVTAVGAIWLDGGFWFQTGTKTRKGRTLCPDWIRTSHAPTIYALDLLEPAPLHTRIVRGEVPSVSRNVCRSAR